MGKVNIIAFVLTALFVLALVAYRLMWAGSQLAATAAMGRLPNVLPKWLRCWLLGESQHKSN